MRQRRTEMGVASARVDVCCNSSRTGWMTGMTGEDLVDRNGEKATKKSRTNERQSLEVCKATILGSDDDDGNEEK